MIETPRAKRVPSARTKPAPKQVFDNKTYACQQCKNGHRVSKCTHGMDRPIAPTNQPGRPSSGSQRKCTCPKRCPCQQTENCNCKENCMCTQKMYLIVHVSKPGGGDLCRSSSPKPEWQNERGERLTLASVWADARGEKLDVQEAERRQQMKIAGAQSKTGSPSSSGSLEESTSTPKPSSCCSSKKAKSEITTPLPTASFAAPSPPIQPSEYASTATPSTKFLQPAMNHRDQLLHSSQHLTPVTSRCNCGTACQCTLCPEHPNNTTTRHYNAQQLSMMTTTPNHGYMPSQATLTGQMYQPLTTQQSCVGGQASYFLSTRPHDQQNMQGVLPGSHEGDYVMSYPMEMDMPMLQQHVVPSFSAQPSFDSTPMDMSVFDDNQMDFGNDSNMTFGNPSFWESNMGHASVDQIPTNASTAFLQPSDFLHMQTTSNEQSMPEDTYYPYGAMDVTSASSEHHDTSPSVYVDPFFTPPPATVDMFDINADQHQFSHQNPPRQSVSSGR